MPADILSDIYDSAIDQAAWERLPKAPAHLIQPGWNLS